MDIGRCVLVLVLALAFSLLDTVVSYIGICYFNFHEVNPFFCRLVKKKGLKGILGSLAGFGYKMLIIFSVYFGMIFVHFNIFSMVLAIYGGLIIAVFHNIQLMMPNHAVSKRILRQRIKTRSILS